MNVHLGVQHAFGQRLFQLRRKALKSARPTTPHSAITLSRNARRIPSSLLYLGHTSPRKTECIVRLITQNYSQARQLDAIRGSRCSIRHCKVHRRPAPTGACAVWLSISRFRKAPWHAGFSCLVCGRIDKSTSNCPTIRSCGPPPPTPSSKKSSDFVSLFPGHDTSHIPANRRRMRSVSYQLRNWLLHKVSLDWCGSVSCVSRSNFCCCFGNAREFATVQAMTSERPPTLEYSDKIDTSISTSL